MEAREEAQSKKIWLRVLWNWLPVVLWAGGIFYLSAQPDLKIEAETLDLILRKVAHFVEFGALAFLVFRVVRGEGAFGARTGRQILLASTIAILYAVSDELHQTFVVTRSGNFLDLIIDVSGVFAAGLIAWRLRCWRKKRKCE